jgi:pimeloyl-ACP methyl ester carboxylesterase
MLTAATASPHACWEPLFSILAQRFQLFAPDRPGCGMTDKIDYRGVDFRKHAIDFVGSLMEACATGRLRPTRPISSQPDTVMPR